MPIDYSRTDMSWYSPKLQLLFAYAINSPYEQTRFLAYRVIVKILEEECGI